MVCDRQTEGWKKWHIEVGAPPKNFITWKYQVMTYYKNLITSTSLEIGPKIFSVRGYRNKNFLPFPLTFWEQAKTLFLEFDSLYPILNEEQGGNWASHTKIYHGNSCSNQNFETVLTSELHRLADNANENHNYITCLFIP